MPFEKGKSGNPGGRPKGARNISSGEVKKIILEILGREFNPDRISEDLKGLKPQQRLNFFLRLASLILPKEQDLKINYERLTPEQVDLIIEKISQQ